MAYQRERDGTTVLMLTKDNLSMWILDIQARLRKKELWKYAQNPFEASIEKDKATTAKCWALHLEKTTEWFKSKQSNDKKRKSSDDGEGASTKYAFAY